jgi:phage shock protein PspC (stress-responsive transcriptional regulator)
MDKTIKINLAGILFQVDEDAYYILRDYLKAIDTRFKHVPGGLETIEDIETRIAEIFQSQKGLAGVISKENVSAMIEIIGRPEDFEQPEHPDQQQPAINARRRLYRDNDDSIIAGVCGGIGSYLNMDPVWVRITFILFTICFGIGFFVYVALWISLPRAISDTQKRELHGAHYNYRTYRQDSQGFYSSPSGSTGENSISRVGGAFNEIFRAIGKFFYIIFRIFMIMFGVTFVITGFTALLAFIMIFFFRYPDFFSMGPNTNLFYLPDFLNYMVNPGISVWILILSTMVIAIPLFGLIYWGIRMIFWFRVRDGVVSLVMFVLWILSIAALAILLANEGVSFSETGRTSSQVIFENKPDTLYIVTSKRVADLQYKKEISLPDDNYAVFMADSTDKLFIRARLRLNVSDDKVAKIEINRRSMGRSRMDAERKAGLLLYDYRISNDTLYLDEYYTIPEGRKWAADDLSVNLYIPENTVLYFEKTTENMFFNRISIGITHDDMISDSSDETPDPWELGNKYWVISSDGLRESLKVPSKQK